MQAETFIPTRNLSYRLHRNRLSDWQDFFTARKKNVCGSTKWAILARHPSDQEVDAVVERGGTALFQIVPEFSLILSGRRHPNAWVLHGTNLHACLEDKWV